MGSIADASGADSPRGSENLTSTFPPDGESGSSSHASARGIQQMLTTSYPSPPSFSWVAAAASGQLRPIMVSQMSGGA